MKVPVVIIGAGPAGTLLSHMLGRAGIDNVVLELRSREHVLGRVRAGRARVGHGRDAARRSASARGWTPRATSTTLINIAWERSRAGVDRHGGARSASEMMGYGQTEIQRDLYDAADASGATIVFEADRHRTARHRPRPRRRSPIAPTASPSGSSATSSPAATASTASAGRRSPPAARTRVRQGLPVRLARDPVGDAAAADPHVRPPRAWVRPVLAAHADAQPLLRAGAADRRRRRLARRPVLDRVAGPRPAPTWRREIVTGPSIEKSLAPLRSFVCEPMRYGSLFLAGDAAHIVPPTGAKGLNLAVSRRLRTSPAGSSITTPATTATSTPTRDVALRRVWGAVRFSWWMTTMLHQFPGPERRSTDRVIEQDLAHLAAFDVRPGGLRRAVRRPPLRPGLSPSGSQRASPQRRSTSITESRWASMAAAAACSSPADDRLDDRRVLLQRLGRPARHHRQAVLVRHGTVAQVVDEVGGDGVPADLAEAAVERAVQFRVARRVVAGDGGAHVGDDLAQLARTRRAWHGAPHAPRSSRSSAARASVISIASPPRCAAPWRRGSAGARRGPPTPAARAPPGRRRGRTSSARRAAASISRSPRGEHTSDDVVAQVVGDGFGPGHAQVRRAGRRRRSSSSGPSPLGPARCGLQLTFEASSTW